MQLQPVEPERRAEAPLDGASFEALFREQFGFVYRNLRRLGVPPAAVEDAVQEVFLVVLRRPDAPITSVRGWLYGIARRIAWRQRRSAGRQDRLAQALADEAPRALDGAVAVAEREAAALLERFLGRLDEDKRAVFLLAELEQMTAPEIARALEVKENTVYSRLRAARQEFDRTFARVRLRERRSTGEAALDERALLLSRARRAGEPDPARRQRAWLVLIAGAGLAAAGEAAAASGGAGPAHVSAWTTAPGPQLAAWSGTTAGGHALGVAVVGLVGAVLVAARPAPNDAPARTAAVEATARGDAHAAARPPAPAPASATLPAPAAPADESSVPFARLAAAAARATPSAPDVFAIGAPAATPVHVSKAMSSGTFHESPPAPGPTPVDLDALRRESTLMAEARAALGAGAWTQAHELLQRHALEFPAGALVEERRLSLVTALCSLGQLEAARAEIARIAGERPDAPAARKARGLCPAAAG